MPKHGVQFYESDDFLLHCLEDYLEAGLVRGEGCLVIATPAHRAYLENRFGGNPDTLRNHLHLLDAAETLQGFHADGTLDEARFRATIGGALKKLGHPERPIRAYGEMVALLWKSGRPETAVELEQLWEGVLAELPEVRLLCAYPMDLFRGQENEAGFVHVCNHHTHVRPTESVVSPTLSEPEQLRAVALLQQKALSLENQTAALEKQVEDIRQLHDLSLRLASLDTVEATLQLVLQHALKMHGAVQGLLSLTTEDGAGLKVGASLGFSAEFLREVEFVPAGSGAYGASLESGRPVVVMDIEEDASFLPWREAAREAGFRSVLSQPLINREGRVIGVLSMHFPVPHRPGRREVDLGTVYVRLAADTLEQAQLRATLQEELRHRRASEESARHFAAIVRSSGDAIVSKDLTSKVTSWNKGAETVFGYTAEEMIGKSITLLIPPHLQDEESLILGRISRGDTLKHYETVRRRKDGRLIDISLTVSPIYDGEGKIIGASKIARDITDRKKIEAALSESEKRFRSMADSAPVFIWMAEASGACTYFNRHRLEFTGRSLERELGSGWLEIVHPEDAAKCRSAFEAGIKSRSPFRLEYRMRRADGAWRSIMDSISPRFSEQGTFLGFIGCGLDLSDLKTAEEQLRQSQKMEAVGRLAGGIAHDFNNLLTSINGFTDLALAKADGDASLREYLGEVQRSGQRATALTRQLLAYSRKQVLAPKPLSLNTSVTEVERMLRRLIGEDISIRTALPVDLGTVMADPGQVQQVILNLALNARDAMPQGGTLTLETANVFLAEDFPSTHLSAPAGAYVMLAVSDTGTGMPPEVLSRLFEPFFTTKAVGKGTGLGLSSVYGIVKQSGGALSVESAPGKGSTFKVFLPLVEDKVAESQGPTGAGPKAALPGAGTILLAEDEAGVRRFLAATLRQRGYFVVEAEDGAQALEVGRKTARLDLLLTDIVMPGLNGTKVAEELRRDRPGLPVLFMSGYARDILNPAALGEPGTSFMQKPFAHRDLLARIQEMLAVPAMATSGRIPA